MTPDLYLADWINLLAGSYYHRAIEMKVTTAEMGVLVATGLYDPIRGLATLEKTYTELCKQYKPVIEGLACMGRFSES